MKQNKIHNIDASGFKAPKNYFDNLEDIILSDIKLKETVNGSGYKTPKGYFNNLEDSIIENIAEKSETKVISLFNKRNLIYISSIAAAVLILFNISIFEREISFDSLDIETAENYIIDEDISSYEIASLLTDEDLLEDNFVKYNFNEETFETYLLNNIDIDDLIVE